MIRFFSEKLEQPSHFTICRDASNQAGVIFLSSCQSTDDLQAALNAAPFGIIVNENRDLLPGMRAQAVQTTMRLEALVKGTKKIAIWHAARLSSQLAKMYKSPAIDYVMLESYWPWRWRFLLWLFFRGNWRRARRAGIVEKLVFVLGTNPDRTDLWSYLPWCNDECTLRAQVGYIVERCRSGGIGMYVHNSISAEFFQQVDEVMFKAFP